MDADLAQRLAALPVAVLLLLALFFQHRQSEKQIDKLEEKLATSEAKREEEHQARLQEKDANSRALMEMGDQVHKAVDVLERQLEANEQMQAQQQQQRRRI